MALGTMERSYYEVLGLCCATEVPLVEKLLRPLEGVDQVSVIVATKTVIVVHDPSVVSRSDIANALNKARMEASLRLAPGEIMSNVNQWPSPYTIACGVLFGLSFLKYVYQPLKWFALAAAIVGAPPILIRGLASIKNFTLNINVLVLISVVGTLALQDYWEAASIVFLFSIAQWLETKASYKVRHLLTFQRISALSVALLMGSLYFVHNNLFAGSKKDINKLNHTRTTVLKPQNPLDGVGMERSMPAENML